MQHLQRFTLALARRRFLVLGLLLGAVAMVATLWLPLNAKAVRRLTVERLARAAVAELKPVDAEPLSPARLVWTGEPEDQAPVTQVLGTPRCQGAAGGPKRPPFALDERGAPLTFAFKTDGATLSLTATFGAQTSTQEARLGDARALLPPLLALLLAVVARQVLIALLSAVLLGASLLAGNPLTALWLELQGIFQAAAQVTGLSEVAPAGVIGGVLASTFNLQILAFTFALVGMVGRMGGTRGLVEALSRFAKGPRSAQLITTFMGTAVFFDDYANTVVVGATGRSLTDERRVSREKLAYIVDSTSAPVAGIALISTWIGYEVGLFEDLLGALSGVPDLPSSGYELFFQVLPMRFYCYFALALVYLIALTNRDLGPMLKAERRVRAGGPVVPPGEGGQGMESPEKRGVKARARNALLPVGLVLAGVVAGVGYLGSQRLASFSLFSAQDWRLAFSGAADDISIILLVSALTGSALAFALALGQRLLTLKEALGAYLQGFKTLLGAAGVLVLAWSIKSVCESLGTGTTLVALVGDSLPQQLLPLSIFWLSGLVAFATGTSWGTMALVLPVAAPLAAQTGDTLVVLASLGAVLDGSIFGDHCSPISDTTVLSSTASGCPHMAHVRTQLPYALLAMVAAAGLGYYPLMLGWSPGWSYLAALLFMTLVLKGLGKRPDPVTAPPA